MKYNLRNRKKIVISSLLIMVIFGAGAIKKSDDSFAYLGVENFDFNKDTRSEDIGSSKGGIHNGWMLPHQEEEAVLDTWFEYNDRDDQFRSMPVAVNYNLVREEDGTQYYVLGLAFREISDSDHTWLETWGDNESLKIEVQFNSKYWASLPINGINRANLETNEFDENIKYHSATAEEAQEWIDANSPDGTGSDLPSEGDVVINGVWDYDDSNNRPDAGKFKLDGIEEGEDWRSYGSNDNPYFGSNPYAWIGDEKGDNIAPVGGTGADNGKNAEKLNAASLVDGYKPSNNDAYAMSNTEVKRKPTFEEWHNYFDEDSNTLYGDEQFTSGEYDPYAHYMVKIPVSDWEDDPYKLDNFGLTPGDGGEGGSAVEHIDNNITNWKVYFDAVSSQDALSINRILIGGKSFESNVQGYQTGPNENGNEQILLSYPNPKFNVDIKGYDENNDFIVDVVYDHTPTPLEYSNVNYVEYTMMGPTTKEDKTQIIWDQIRIGDGWATRESRNSLSDPETHMVDGFYDSLSDEWKDDNTNEGEFNADGQYVGGYPVGMELPDYDGDGFPDGEYKGDMNIAGDEKITETINYGDLFYGDDPTDTEMKYTFTSKISVTPTEFGRENAFLSSSTGEEILSQYDEKLILPGPTAPVIEHFDIIKDDIDLANIDPTSSFNVEVSGDSESIEEVAAHQYAGLQETGLDTVQVVAYEYDFVSGFVHTTNRVDLTDKINVSEGATTDGWNYDSATGKFNGEFATQPNKLNPKKDYILTLEWTYGKGVYSDASTRDVLTTGLVELEEDKDQMITFHTTSAGSKDIELTNNTISGGPSGEWGNGNWTFTYTFDYDQVIPSDALYDDSAYDDVEVENFQIINNAGTPEEDVILTNTPEEVEPGFDSLSSYDELTIEIPSINLVPDTEYNLSVRANTTSGESFDSSSSNITPIIGPDSHAPEITSINASDYYVDSMDRTIHSDINLTIDAFTNQEAIDASWADGSSSNINNIEILDESDNIVATIDGASLNIDETGDGVVETTVKTNDLLARHDYTFKAKVNFGSKGEAPIYSNEFNLTTGSRGIADVIASEPTVDQFTLDTKGFTTTATTTINSSAIGSYDLADFDDPEVTTVEIVSYDEKGNSKSLGSTDVSTSLPSDGSSMEVNIDIPTIEYNSSYELGVVVNTASGDKFYSEKNTNGVTDAVDSFAPTFGDLQIKEYDTNTSSSEDGYKGVVFEFNITTQVGDGIDELETSMTNLSSLNLKLLDGETEMQSWDLMSAYDSSYSDTTLKTQKIETESSSEIFFPQEYNYVIDYTYGDGKVGSQDGIIQFTNQGIEDVEITDINITKAEGAQTGFKLSGNISNSAAMFWDSYIVKNMLILDENDNEINLVQTKFNGEEVTSGNGNQIDVDGTSTNGEFEIVAGGIKPGTNVKEYSLQIETNKDDSTLYSFKLGQISNIFETDESTGNVSFIDTDPSNKGNEVIDNDAFIDFYVDENNIIADPKTGTIKFDLHLENQTGLTFEKDSIVIHDQYGNDYSESNGKLEIVENNTRELVESITLKGLEDAKNYSFTMSISVNDSTMDSFDYDEASTFETTQNLFDFNLQKAGHFPWWILILLLITIIGAVLFLLWWFLLRGPKVVSIVEIKESTATFSINRDAQSEFDKQIKGRILRVNQGEEEKEIDYSLKINDVDQIEITLNGISNNEVVNSITFLADKSLNDKLEKTYEKDLAKYEKDLDKFNNDMEKWNEAKAKAAEAEKEFDTPKPTKPSKPTKPKLSKDIKVSGKVDTEIVENSNGSTTKPKNLSATADLMIEKK